MIVFLRVLFVAILVILAARWLGVEGFGIFSYASTIGLLLIPMTDLGLQIFLTRELAAGGQQPGSVFATVLRLKLALTLAVAAGTQSWIPVMLIGGPRIYGCWHMLMTGTIQHCGLAENVIDHRLNSRTVYMNPISQWIYWNMNYHVEHHMFPLVPYHALPKLHETIRDDCPPPYPSILSAWKEIWPAVLRQIKDPGYHVKRKLPQPRKRGGDSPLARSVDEQGRPRLPSDAIADGVGIEDEPGWN